MIEQQKYDVLVVDDYIKDLEQLCEVVRKAGYVPLGVSSAKDAIQAIGQKMPKLILSDICMPDIDGYELCEILKENPRTRDIPIIFASALSAMDERTKGFDAGAVDYIVKPFNMKEATSRVATHIRLFMMKNELEDYNSNLHAIVQNQMKQILENQKNVIFALAKLSEIRDDDTGHHMLRIGKYAKLVADRLQYVGKFANKVTSQFIDEIEMAAQLHDIGKVAISDTILLKPGKLTDREREIMKTHTEWGAFTLKEVYKDNQSNHFLQMAIEIALCHHERWDGTGYPSGMKGEDIPLAARIMAIVDVYDALTTRRIYKEFFPDEKSLAIVAEESGKMFDPDIAEVFIKVHDEIKEIKQQYFTEEEGADFEMSLERLKMKYAHMDIWHEK